MTNVLDDLLTYIPSPAKLLSEAEALVAEDSTYREIRHDDSYPSYVFYLSNDGGGQEGNIVFYMNGETVEALLYAYDHESQLAPVLDKNDSEESFNSISKIWVNVPSALRKPVMQNSPLLWKFDGYPLTYQVAYATVAVWTENGRWVTDQDDDTAQEKANHLKYSFTDFDFIKKFREETN